MNTEQQLREALQEIDNNSHPDYCDSTNDICIECGYEFDEHPVTLEGPRICEEFQLRPCTCGIAAALALPVTPVRVEFRGVCEELDGSWFKDTLKGSSVTDFVLWAGYRKKHPEIYRNVRIETCTISESPWVEYKPTKEGTDA